MGPISEWYSDTRPDVSPDGSTAFYRSSSGRSAVLVEEKRDEGFDWPNKGWVIYYFSDHGEDEASPWPSIEEWIISERLEKGWYSTPNDIDEAREFLANLPS